MSGMSLQVALRAIQKNKTIDELYEIAKSLYLRDADDDYVKGGITYYFKYENENNNICVNEIDGKICLDYMLNDQHEAYGVNETITLKDILKIKKWLKKYGFDTEEISYKVLYFHNGGCSGLGETK